MFFWISVWISEAGMKFMSFLRVFIALLPAHNEDLRSFCIIFIFFLNASRII